VTLSNLGGGMAQIDRSCQDLSVLGKLWQKCGGLGAAGADVGQRAGKL
jgi:hypothetical protein